MIVVDTNLIAYLVLPGQRSARARDVLRRDSEWMAPLLWRSELRNVLAPYERQGHLKIEDSLELMEAAERLMKGGEYEVRSQDVLRLAARSGCSAYDCEFVALARDLEVALVTTDRDVLKAFPGIARSLDRFARGK